MLIEFVLTGSVKKLGIFKIKCGANNLLTENCI